MTIVSVNQIHINQTWYPRDGTGTVLRVIGFRRINVGEWDVDVWYEWYDEHGQRHEYSKNAYVFQVNNFCPQLEQQSHSLNEAQRHSVWRK